MRFTLDNRSGYDTESLRRFLARGLSALVRQGSKLDRRRVRITVVASPIRSRGCATVGGRSMVLAVASPSRFSMRRLARLLEHEVAHLAGMEHEDMDEKLLYSLGPTPDWARGATLRYRGRAPDQVPLLSRRA